jgi:hypothetical protein
MQSIIGPALLCVVVLAVMAVRPKASGAAPHFMSYSGMDEIVAFALTVTAAFGIVVTAAGFTSLF